MNTLPGLDPHAVERAAQRLAEGGLVAFATETVYGLGARADDDRAVAGIFALKGRPADHPLIVHVADIAAASQFADVTGSSAQRLMAQLWPGPVSLVVQRRPGMASAAAGGLPTLALRCPSHPFAQALLRRCQELGVPGVAAPSANRFGRVSPTRAEHVREEFGPDLLILDGGPCEAGIESAIIDCSSPVPRLLRPGSMPRQRLEAALGFALEDPVARSPRVSGSLASHYAPQAEVCLAPADALAETLQGLQARHGRERVALWARAADKPSGLPEPCFSAMPDNAVDAARELFHLLRHWDALGMRAICVQALPADAAWEGVEDRLRRAAAPR